MVRYLEVIWLDVTIFTSYLGRNCRPDERMCKSSPKVISRKILSLLEVEEDLLQLNLGGVVTGDNLGWNTIWNKVILIIINGFPGSPVVKKKNLPTNAGNSGSVHWEDLQTEMATHCSILSWRIPRSEESGRLQSMRSQKSWIWLNNLTTSNYH